MDRKNNRNQRTNQLCLCLYTIASLLTPGVALAEVTNVAGPSASATGNVTNQAVQVLQGPYPTSTYGGGIGCAGPSLSVSPFVMGGTNWSEDPDEFAGHSQNAGISVGFNIPLDGSLTALCRARVEVEIARMQAEADKARLDFELVRLMKCAEVMQTGFTFHPDSPYAAICADVIPINTYNQIVMNEAGISQSEGESPTGLDQTETDRGAGDPPGGHQDSSDGGVGGGHQDGPSSEGEVPLQS
jgi:hypothetical protein